MKEYIIRLCKRRLVLKTAEQQQQLAGHVLANADLIQRFCTQNVSKPGARASQNLCGRPSGRGSPPQPGLCLQGSPAAWLHQALPTLAEIIRLQDPSAIKIEVATYATFYPDFR